MEYTSMFAIVVLFKIHLCVPIVMRQYHTTFAMTISQCSQQYYIIRNTGIFTIIWFDDCSASWVHRGNDHHPPHIIDHFQTPWRQQG